MSSQIEEVGIRLRADGVVETTSGMNLSAAAVDKLARAANDAKKPLADLGISAGQTRAAMRQLPAQITDIVTSLASGQSAFTVAIQQGGQIKDSFGGIVPAGQALLGLMNPLAVAVGGLAAGAGALGLAYAQGAREQDAFARSMVMTGNAAGTTMNQMVAMARGMAQVRGTQAEASDALAQLAGTAQVAGRDLQKFGELAIQMERMTGQSVDKTVKTFAELGRAPLQASIKLNEGTNFLTKSLYEQIRALEKQGRTADAASVAQNALADVMKTRLDELEGRLGYIESAWKRVKDEAGLAWDRMLGIGRQETLDDQIKQAQQRVTAARRRADEPSTLNGATGRRTLSGNAQIMQEELTLSMLLRQKFDEEAAAANKAAAAEKVKHEIAAREKDKGPSAADKTLAERIALMGRVYGGLPYIDPKYATPDQTLALQDERRHALDRRFRLSEIGSTDATNTAMRTAAAQAEDAITKARESSATAAERSAQALEREAATLADHTAEIGLNEGALLARRQAQLDAQIGEAATLLSVIEGAAGYERQTEALQRQIAALERMKGLQGDAAFKTSNEAWRKDNEQRAVAEAAENRRRTEGLANSIEEGLMNGFRNGGSLADIFLNELKAQFARTVLRPMIEPIAAGLGGGSGMGGLFSAAMSLFSGGGVPIGAEFQTGLPMAGFARVGEGWHGGGVGGTDRPAFTRSLPAATWAGAPRFHTGIGPDEVPAVLQRTEGVFTQGQMKAMAPVSDLAKVGGNRITFAPNISIDSRTDRAEVGALVQSAMRQSQAELLEMMDRRMA